MEYSMRTLKKLLLAISMCCLVATANAAPMDDINAAYDRGDYAQAPLNTVRVAIIIV